MLTFSLGLILEQNICVLATPTPRIGKHPLVIVPPSGICSLSHACTCMYILINFLFFSSHINNRSQLILVHMHTCTHRNGSLLELILIGFYSGNSSNITHLDTRTCIICYYKQ